MAVSNKTLNDKLRAQYLSVITDFFRSRGEEVIQTASGEIAMPCVDEQGGEKWVVIPVKIPTGDREGNPYDGYAMGQEYAMKQTEKAEKAKVAAEAKAKKMAKDAKLREKKVKA